MPVTTNSDQNSSSSAAAPSTSVKRKEEGPEASAPNKRVKVTTSAASSSISSAGATIEAGAKAEAKAKVTAAIAAGTVIVICRGSRNQVIHALLEELETIKSIEECNKIQRVINKTFSHEYGQFFKIYAEKKHPKHDSWAFLLLKACSYVYKGPQYLKQAIEKAREENKLDIVAIIEKIKAYPQEPIQAAAASATATAEAISIQAYPLETYTPPLPMLPIPIVPKIDSSAAAAYNPFLNNGMFYMPPLSAGVPISTAGGAIILPPLPPLPVPYSNDTVSNSSSDAAAHNLYPANGTMYTPPLAAAEATATSGTTILAPIPVFPDLDQVAQLDSEYSRTSSDNAEVALTISDNPFGLTEEEKASAKVLGLAAAVLDAPTGNLDTSTSSVGTSSIGVVHGNGDLTFPSSSEEVNDNSVSVAGLPVSTDRYVPLAYVPGSPISPHVRHSIFSPLPSSLTSTNVESPTVLQFS